MIPLSFVAWEDNTSRGNGPFPVAGPLFTFEAAPKPVCLGAPVRTVLPAHRLVPHGCSCRDRGWLPR